MKLETAKPGRMTETGSSLLKLMQTGDLPTLDLLVRESLQNSLDAKNNDRYVKVDFQTGAFKAGKLNEHLEGATENLNKRFGKNSICSFIEIRDSNTVGLTGPLSIIDVSSPADYGNLLKLVYEISKNQTAEGAGGSWGLGKTIYYRVGIGLVFFYSRIRVGSTFASRLAACLVEDETGDTIVDYGKNLKRGIAWWGEKERPRADTTVPLTKNRDIQEILEVFDIAPFKGPETGTSIIIPYIDESRLLEETLAKLEKDAARPYWTDSIEEYLTVSVQRWYAPRLSNTQYKYGAHLKASVNGNQIKPSEMLPLFRTVRDLYLYATGAELDDDSLLLAENVKLCKEPIRKNSVLSKGNIIGYLAYAKLTAKNLKMLPPDNEASPYRQIDNAETGRENNSPIIMYTRRPGMIVNYDTTEYGLFTPSDEYVLALFVPDSLIKMTGKYKDSHGNPLTLEEYFRKGEKAEHAVWQDSNITGGNPGIITTLFKRTNDILKKEYTVKEKQTGETEKTGLSAKLADLLLPDSGFGTVPDWHVTPGNDPPSKPKVKKSRIVISGGPYFRNGEIELEYQLYLKGKTTDVSLNVLGERGSYNADDWETDDVGLKFPFEIKKFTVEKINDPRKKGRPIICERFLDCANTLSEGTANDFDIRLLKSFRHNTFSKIRIELNSSSGKELYGKLILSADARDMMCEVIAEEVKKDE